MTTQAPEIIEVPADSDQVRCDGGTGLWGIQWFGTHSMGWTVSNAVIVIACS